MSLDKLIKDINKMKPLPTLEERVERLEEVMISTCGVFFDASCELQAATVEIKKLRRSNGFWGVLCEKVKLNFVLNKRSQRE